MKKASITLCGTPLLDGPVNVASTFFERFQGLMLKKSIKPEEGLIFIGVNQVHTHFMRFDIDVVHISKDFEVLEVETLKPWKIGTKNKDTKYVLELNRGVGSRFKIGEKINIQFK